MKLSNLLKPWCTQFIVDCDVLGLHHDSREIKPGFLFIAYPGGAHDGRIFVQQAIAAGAVAIAYDPVNLPASFVVSDEVIYVPVPELANQLAAIASRFYHEPSQGLSVTGITGTNGKTTIAWLLAQAYQLLGFKAAYIGTLGIGDIHALQVINNTTPDALFLQRLLSQYQQDGVDQICMEVSSHALVQGRVEHIDFNQAIYTNLSHEHLDYHKTLEAYALAKAQLFATPSLEYALLNQDDAYYPLMKAQLPASCQLLSYGLGDEADVRAVNLQINLSGSIFDVTSPWGTHQLRMKTLGKFNVYNSLAVFSSLLARGFNPETLVHVMSQLQATPGRMELVSEKPCVIVDYAHTPDALDNVLSTLTPLKQGQLWVIFGCGGDRDRTKRPMMGNIASQYADKIILTSDNPRSEDPAQIIDEIASGISNSKLTETIIDRKQAIHYALERAEQQDIILIAGKGHEAYQQIGQQRFVFSDQEVVRGFNLKHLI